MKHKFLVLIFFFLFSLTIFFYQSFLTIKYRSQWEDDQQFSTLIQKIEYPTNQNFGRITSKQKLSFLFSANHNNLGTVSFLFNNYQKINSDWVWFRIKEANSPVWYYQNKYNTEQFNPEYFFPFGFPVINDSKNKDFIVEIESISGTNKNSISLNKKTNSFLTKYSYSKEYLKKNPNEIFYFLSKKLLHYLSYIPRSDINTIFFKSFLPEFLFFSILIFFILKKYFYKIKILKKFKFLIPLFLFFSSFFISFYFSKFGTDPHHDGIMFKPALDVNHGLMLFRDTFTQYGALSTLIQASFIKIFGEYLIVVKFSTALFYGLTLVLLYSIWSKFLDGFLSFLCSLIYIFLAPYFVLTFLPWSSVYALFFQSFSIFFFLKYLKNFQLKYIFFVGMFSALTFWCKQNVGGYTILASITSIILLKYSKNNNNFNFFSAIFKYIYGGLAISIPFFVWLIFNNAFTDWWKQSILYALFFIGSKSEINFFSSMFPASVGPISVWSILPLSSTLAFLISYFSKKPNIKFSIFSVFCLFSWLQYYPVTCIRHLYWASAPSIGIFVYLLFQTLKNSFSQKKTIIYIIIIFFIILVFYPDIKYRVDNGIKIIQKPYTELNFPNELKGIRLSINEANFYQQTYNNIVKYKNKFKDTNIITIGPNALYLALVDSNNFHKMYINWGSPILGIYPEYSKIKDNYIEKNQPLIFSIWGLIPPNYCRFDDLTNESDTSFLIGPCNKLKSL